MKGTNNVKRLSAAKLLTAAGALIIGMALTAGLIGCDNGSGGGGGNSLPALTGTVTITGNAAVDETLTADTTSLVYEAGGTLSYQWKAGTNNVGTDQNTYLVRNSDMGETITVTVTASGNSGSITSGPTQAVTAPLPALTGAVAITGWVQLGQTLTADISALGGSGAISYQWKRADTSGGSYSNIAGATAQTYTLVAEDVGKWLMVSVTRAGYGGSKESDRKGAVAAAVTTATTDNLLSVLEGLADNTWDTPYTISLEAGTNISDNWVAIYVAVFNSRKYVILDLSACSATGNTVTGKQSPSGNDFNGFSGSRMGDITGIILPDTLTSIGDYAFYYCDGLASVTIPASVTSIGLYAFDHCESLTSMTIPAGVTSIERNAFDHCASLTSVTFAGNNVASFGVFAFPEGSYGDGGNSLKTAYEAADPHAGTYTREPDGSTWTKVTE